MLRGKLTDEERMAAVQEYLKGEGSYTKNSGNCKGVVTERSKKMLEELLDKIMKEK